MRARKSTAVASRTHAVERYLADLASAAPAPGGGSAAALAAALGAALVAMTCRVTAKHAGAAPSVVPLGELAEEADSLRRRLTALANDDARVYSDVIAARRLPVPEREPAVQHALERATEVPQRLAAESRNVLALCERIAPCRARQHPQRPGRGGHPGPRRPAGRRAHRQDESRRHRRRRLHRRDDPPARRPRRRGHDARRADRDGAGRARRSRILTRCAARTVPELMEALASFPRERHLASARAPSGAGGARPPPRGGARPGGRAPARAAERGLGRGDGLSRASPGASRSPSRARLHRGELRAARRRRAARRGGAASRRRGRGNGADKGLTLESADCFFECSMAPMIEVDGAYHGRVAPDDVAHLDRWFRAHAHHPAAPRAAPRRRHAIRRRPRRRRRRARIGRGRAGPPRRGGGRAAARPTRAAAQRPDGNVRPRRERRGAPRRAPSSRGGGAASTRRSSRARAMACATPPRRSRSHTPAGPAPSSSASRSPRCPRSSTPWPATAALGATGIA